jgi:hypothetical protein
MSHRSKREVAPPTNQAPAVGPWQGAAGKTNIFFPPSGQTMAPPPGKGTDPHDGLEVGKKFL